jgi:hypothetical protein
MEHFAKDILPHSTHLLLSTSHHGIDVILNLSISDKTRIRLAVFIII